MFTSLFRDIREIWEYARVRGIRIVPELDTPSHVGAGWEKTGFVTCFNWQPWQKYCVEPPCGQLNPTVDGLYDFIEGMIFIYRYLFPSQNIFKWSVNPKKASEPGLITGVILKESPRKGVVMLT